MLFVKYLETEINYKLIIKKFYLIYKELNWERTKM